jgi:DNA-binding MarR family transcriptional regulator
MPILDMPQGTDVLVWLFKGGVRTRPLKDLYRGSRFSEPTMRLVLKALVDDGFIAIDRNPDDLRVRTVQLTPKLVEAVNAYLRLLRDCATSFRQFDSPDLGHTAIDTSSETLDHAA